MMSVGPILRPVLVAGAVLTASLVVQAAGIPKFIAVAVPALVALLVGVPVFRSVNAALRHAQARTAANDEVAQARLVEFGAARAELRHDLRGILSPALLTADRLAMSQDPTARRAGETMITTVERAVERLQRD